MPRKALNIFRNTENIASLWKKYLARIFPYFFLVLVVWFSRFLYIDSLGFYEDDWGFSGTAISNNLSDNWLRIESAIMSFWQGRPLHMTFLTFIPFLGAKLGGLKAIYLIGFIILATNTCLWYFLVLRISQRTLLATLSSLFFALYPADTTFSFLQHLLGIQTALLLLLIAFHYFIIDPNSKYHLASKVTSYFFATLSLLDYESLFLVFFVAPFLSPHRTTKNQKTIHALILFTILCVYFFLRKLLGESRISEAIGAGLGQKLLSQVFLGPVIVFSTFFRRMGEVIFPFSVLNLGLVAISALVFSFVLHFLLNQQLPWVANEDLGKVERQTRVLASRALLMTVLAYPSALLLDVAIIDGRASRVHFSAVLGMTLLMSCGWLSLFLWSQKHHLLKMTIFATLILQLACLFTFSINIQYYYRLSWQYQQAFWSDVLTLAPDLTEGTVILLDAPELPWGKQINPFDWSMPLVLESIYKFPADWQYRPRLYGINPEFTGIERWSQEIIEQDQLILSSHNRGLRFYFPWEAPRKVSLDQVILIERKGDNLVRQEHLSIGGTRNIALKPKSTQVKYANHQKTIIFNNLIVEQKKCTYCQLSPPLYFRVQQ